MCVRHFRIWPQPSRIAADKAPGQQLYIQAAEKNLEWGNYRRGSKEYKREEMVVAYTETPANDDNRQHKAELGEERRRRRSAE